MYNGIALNKEYVIISDLTNLLKVNIKLVLVDDNYFRNKKVKLNFLETIIISNTKYDLVVTVLHILNGKYVTHLLATLIDQTNFNK